MTIATFLASTRMNPTTNTSQWKCHYVGVPHAVLTHPSFQELSGSSAKLLLALLAGYVGNNNGHLTATFSRMKTFGFNSKETVARALQVLITLGYIVRTRKRRLRSPALYAVTWLPINRPSMGQPYEAGISAGDESVDSWRVGSDTQQEAA